MPESIGPAPIECLADRRRRVSALAVEIAHEMGFTADRIAVLNAPRPSQDEATQLTPDVQALVELATRVDDALLVVDDQERSFSTLLAELWGAAALGTVCFDALSALDRIFERYSPLVLKTPPRLGVCPAVMFKALSLLLREKVTLTEIEKVSECDPMLATSLLRFANSALMERNTPVRSVRAAIARIGFDAARRVILAASTRPLFGSASLRDLWQHSVDVAAIAEQLAATTGVCDPAEAFVAGLIHDLGRLALEMTREDDFAIAHQRLAGASGCSILADFVLAGRDHGEIGAAILSTWRMPGQLVDAIRYHHRPELSGAASPAILHLAECVSNPAEGIPSLARLDRALHTVGLDSLDTVQSDAHRLSAALATIR